MNHGDMHPGFAALGAFFIVFAQPSASAQPSQGAFHHPPPGQDLKVVAVWFALDHGQQPTARSPSPRHQSARVASICPDHLQSGESTQQFGQHQLGAVPVPVSWHGAGSGCWQHEPPRPAAIPWYPPRCAACVRLPVCQRRNPEAPFFRGLHRLAIDDRRAGRSLSPSHFPNPDPQGFLNPFPGPVISPLPEVPPDRAPRWQVMGASVARVCRRAARTGCR